jgi:hypothetical protein
MIGRKARHISASSARGTQQQGERKPGHRLTFPFIGGIADFLYMGEPTAGREDRRDVIGHCPVKPELLKPVSPGMETFSDYSGSRF